MTWFWWFFSVLLGVVAVYFVHAAFKYTRMISHIFMSLVYKPVQEPVESSRAEKVSILDSADEEIEILLTRSGKSRKVVIFCPESGASKDTWEKYAYFLPECGYHLLSLDYPKPTVDDGKNSLSQWPSASDVSRLLVVIRWAKKAIAEDIDILLFGVSKGADVAFAASFHDTNVKAVVADGLFSMKEVFRDYIRKWAPILVKPNLFGERYPEWIVATFTNLGFWFSQKKAGARFVEVENLLKQTHVPLLMIHGAKDDYVSPTHRDFLEKIDSSGEQGLHLVVSEARHNQAVVVGREMYERKIMEFLSRQS